MNRSSYLRDLLYDVHCSAKHGGACASCRLALHRAHTLPALAALMDAVAGSWEMWWPKLSKRKFGSGKFQTRL